MLRTLKLHQGTLIWHIPPGKWKEIGNWEKANAPGKPASFVLCKTLPETAPPRVCYQAHLLTCAGIWCTAGYIQSQKLSYKQQTSQQPGNWDRPGLARSRPAPARCCFWRAVLLPCSTMPAFFWTPSPSGSRIAFLTPRLHKPTGPIASCIKKDGGGETM